MATVPGQSYDLDDYIKRQRDGINVQSKDVADNNNDISREVNRLYAMFAALQAALIAGASLSFIPGAATIAAGGATVDLAAILRYTKAVWSNVKNLNDRYRKLATLNYRLGLATGQKMLLDELAKKGSVSGVQVTYTGPGKFTVTNTDSGKSTNIDTGNIDSHDGIQASGTVKSGLMPLLAIGGLIGAVVLFMGKDKKSA